MMDLNYNDLFEKQMENLFQEGDNVNVITPGGVTTKLVSLLCRRENKFGIFISYTPPNKIGESEILDHINENVENLNIFENEEKLESDVITGLFVRGWTLVTFDEEEDMMEFYSNVPEHNRGTPFYVCTIHKSGKILTENT